MRGITILIMVLICLFGLVWIGSGIEKVGESDIGDNLSQDQAEQIYSPITQITSIAVSTVPYIAILLVIFGLFKLLDVY
jgi:uncharacterized membrane protein YphA (DoxX/SURF4 family)